jgi:hypothetical protein
MSSRFPDVFRVPRCLQGSPMSSGFPDVFRVPRCLQGSPMSSGFPMLWGGMWREIGFLAA